MGARKRRKWYLPALLIVLTSMLVFSLSMDFLLQKDSHSSVSAAFSISENEEKLDTLVFPTDEVVDVRITIDEEDFQDMIENASLEEMKTADVEYNGIKIENIGIRTKGNSSLSSVVRSDSDRYSFKLSFDEYISNQTLYGISKINLNNNFNDASLMREYLTYELAKEMGLPVPKYSYVNVYVNDELWGFYLAVEQIGTAYLERNFDDAYGSLYKADMGSGTDLVWTGDDRESYAGLIQKSDHADDDALLKMIDELNNGSDYESVLDVENALKYIALNVATYNMDSYIGGNMHNYYLYEQDGQFSILPWDFNMAFDGMPNGGGQGGGRGGGQGAPFGNQRRDVAVEPDAAIERDEVGDRVVNGAGPVNEGAFNEEIGEFAANMNQESGVSTLDIFNPSQSGSRPLISNLLQVDQYKELYTSYLQEAIETYLEPDILAAKAYELKELISPYMKEDPRPFYTYEQFEEGIDELLETNAEIVENIQRQLDGETNESVSLSVASVTDSLPPSLSRTEENMEETESPRMMTNDGQLAMEEGGMMRGGLPAQAEEMNENIQAPDQQQLQQGMPGRMQEGMRPFAENGMTSETSTNENTGELITSFILLVLLSLAAIFITRYKNKRI